MARHRSSASSRSSSRPAAAPSRKPAQPVPAPQAPPPAAAMPPQPQQPGLFAQMATTAAGVAVGHSIGNAITGVFSGGSGSGHSTEPVQAAPAATGAPAQQAAPACSFESDAFLRCLESSNNDMNICQPYMDMLKQCRDTAQRAYY